MNDWLNRMAAEKDQLTTRLKTYYEFIGRQRLALTDEKRAQQDLANAFVAAGISFQRELQLTIEDVPEDRRAQATHKRDIPDFMLPGGVVVELKLRGNQKVAVFNQLERYAQHDGVKAIMLVTNLAMGLPEEINGKPAFIISMGRAWL
ncbi:MAG: hypothetical protein KBC46_03385 [Ferrovibrio sp.]|nr:hypothetical protein [Ferrovibrio sp.]